mmetsp:Transcript_18004/g.48956  ORF Transcript_18004/g.48956 Transcript_18004/m.48956 type:complete len:430 (+) Transcript_18004:80-1369(+)
MLLIGRGPATGSQRTAMGHGLDDHGPRVPTQGPVCLVPLAQPTEHVLEGCGIDAFGVGALSPVERSVGAVDAAVPLSRPRPAAGALQALLDAGEERLQDTPAGAAQPPVRDVHVLELVVVQDGQLRVPAEEHQSHGCHDKRGGEGLHPIHWDAGVPIARSKLGCAQEQLEHAAHGEPPHCDYAPHVVQDARRQQVLRLNVWAMLVDPVRQVIAIHNMLHCEEERRARQCTWHCGTHTDAHRVDTDSPSVPIAPSEHPCFLGFHALAGSSRISPCVRSAEELRDLQQRVHVGEASTIDDVPNGKDAGRVHHGLEELLHYRAHHPYGVLAHADLRPLDESVDAVHFQDGDHQRIEDQEDRIEMELDDLHRGLPMGLRGSGNPVDDLWQEQGVDCHKYDGGSLVGHRLHPAAFQVFQEHHEVLRAGSMGKLL